MGGYLCSLAVVVSLPGLVLPLQGARYLVETAFGGYCSRLLCDWSPPYGFDPAAVSCVVPDRPNVWTDGRLVLDKVADVSSSGAGFFANHAASFWDVRSWRQFDTLRSVGDSPVLQGFLLCSWAFSVCSEGGNVGSYSGFTVFGCCSFGP